MNEPSVPSLDELREQHPRWAIWYEASIRRYRAVPLYGRELKAREAETLQELAAMIRFVDRTHEE